MVNGRRYSAAYVLSKSARFRASRSNSRLVTSYTGQPGWKPSALDHFDRSASQYSTLRGSATSSAIYGLLARGGLPARPPRLIRQGKRVRCESLQKVCLSIKIVFGAARSA